MRSSAVRIIRLSRLVLVTLALILPTVQAKYTPFIPNSFFFSYDPPNVSPPFPVTEQCQTINITWSRGSAMGPNPVAPYFLQVYTSKFIVPFKIAAGSGLSFQWQVPFVPGTLYQICMFDSVGNSGGCQATYSVIASTASTTPPTCTNVTFPAGAMDVLAEVADGQLSQNGWISQCTDIAVTPRNGTPPYIFTIAPALHPPYNITSNSRSIMNWTVSLTWAMPFFISVIDSAGNSWANGPLHSGSGISSECLAVTSPNTTQTSKPFPKTTVASAIGSAIGGIVLGVIITYVFLLYRTKSGRGLSRFAPPLPGSHPNQISSRVLSSSSHYRSVPSVDAGLPTANPLLGDAYHVEPFAMPSESGRGSRQRPPSTSNLTDIRSSSQGPRSEAGSSSAAQSSSQSPSRQVYVVHHDGGRVPISVYTPSGAVVEELPPGYPGDLARALTMGPSDETVELPYSRRRNAGPTPQKGAPSSTFYTTN